MIDPPRVALWLHERSLSCDEREAVIGDVIEEFNRRAAVECFRGSPLDLG